MMGIPRATRVSTSPQQAEVEALVIWKMVSTLSSLEASNEDEDDDVLCRAPACCEQKVEFHSCLKPV